MKLVFQYVISFIMFFIRAAVIGYFVMMFKEFSSMVANYQRSIRSPGTSAVQATQISNEYILYALSLIGQLVVVIAVIMVIEAMYRGAKRSSAETVAKS